MVDLQSTNRTRLGKVRETTFGVTPNNPAFKAQRQTGSPLNANPTTVVSNEIREDRQLTDTILVGVNAGGDINAELSFSAHDDDLEEAVQGTWANKPFIEVLTADTEISDVSTTTLTVAASLGTPFKAGMVVATSGFSTPANNRRARVSSSSGTTVVFPASTFTAEAAVPVGAKARVVGFQGASGDIAATVTNGNALTSTLLDFTTLDIAKGDWIRIGDGEADNSFTTVADNNGWARVSVTPTAQRLSFDVVPSGWGADAGTGKTIMIFYGDRLRNGSQKRSNTFERQYLDHSPISYEYFTGQTLNTLVMNFAQQAVITMVKTYMGKDGKINPYGAGVRATGATDIAAPTNDVLNTSSDVADIAMDGSIIAGPNFVLTTTLTINNNLRAQPAIGHLGAVGIGNGEFNVTLSAFSTYFGSPELAQKLRNQTEFSFNTLLQAPDDNNESYMIDLPKLKMTQGAPAVTGKNADVILNGAAQGLYDPDLGYTMGINRFWFLPAEAAN